MMFRRRRAIVCRQAVELVTDYLEGTLAPKDRTRFEAHLDECPHCREYLAQMQVTIAAAGYIEPDALEAQVRVDLITLYRSWQAG